MEQEDEFGSKERFIFLWKSNELNESLLLKKNAMLQYLFNSGCIWLLGLLCYDVFLRKETFHNYNRFYLLFTMMLGLALPIVRQPGGRFVTVDSASGPISQVAMARQNVDEFTSVAPPVGPQWLMIIYLCGTGIATIFLIIEIVNLTKYYTTGSRSRDGNWTIVATGRTHAPFSLLNILFVNTISQYSAEEWRMICLHERQHHRLLHLVDLMVLQLLGILFWFHPLIYLYRKRLLLVHEYQADTMSSKEPVLYCKFLIEQSLFQSSPSITHSLNRSSLKNRILMLTRTSSSVAKTKMLVILPLALACVLCFSKTVYSQSAKEGKRTVIPFGVTDTAKLITVTYDQILSNPRIVCTEPGCEVTGFEFSYLLSSGADPYRGPFVVNGNELTDHLKAQLADVNKSDNSKTRMFIENIRMTRNGKEETVAPIVLRARAN